MTRPAAPPIIALALLVVAPGAAARDHGPVSRLFISPMGEPFRSDLDGDPEAAWFAGADTDHDDRISLAEFQADAQRWFVALDRNHDGEIDPDEIEFYETRLVPEIRVADAPRSGAIATGAPTRPAGRRGANGGGGSTGGGRRPGSMGGAGGFGGRRGGSRADSDGAKSTGGTAVPRTTRQGASRYSYLDFPEPLTSADANLNRGIDRTEMANAAAQRFALLDKNGDGYLERHELPRVDTRVSGAGPRRDHPAEPRRSSATDDDRQLGGGDREQD